MKTLVQKFLSWFNRKHGRVGTLWETRFKIVLAEGSWVCLLKVAAYIDLNAVRGEAGRAEISPGEVAKVWAAGGKLSLAQLLRCRVRHFSDGVAVGSAEFLENSPPPGV